MTVSISIELMRSRIARPCDTRLTRYWFSISLTDRADPAVPEVIDVVDLAVAVLQIDQHLEDCQYLCFA